jgi:non-heme chloroperoxidase
MSKARGAFVQTETSMETTELQARDRRRVEAVRRWVDVAGGVRLHTLQAGAGPPLVMLPGWSQTAEMFREQLVGLSGERRVIAVDHRGHGPSSAPAGGYRIHRLAADLEQLLRRLELERVDLLAHSMGVSVACAYLDLFGPERISSLVLVDEMPRALREPDWTDEQAEEAGATMDPAGLFEFVAGLRAPGGEHLRVDFLHTVTSDGIEPETLAWMAEQNETFPRPQAADLIFNNAVQDWRDLIPAIRLPTLVVAGDSVNVPLRSQRWIHEQIPGSELAVISARSGGTHFPFLESPAELNERVSSFLAS